MYAFSKSNTKSISVRAKVDIETEFGKAEFFTFEGLKPGEEHFAIGYGPWRESSSPLVRAHSECITGDLFRSYRCDCGKQLQEAIQRFSKEGGIVIYLRQEGRGIGLYNKLDAYLLQQKGMDTFAANRELGFQEDSRDFYLVPGILNALGVDEIRMLTNNPHKVEPIRQMGINVREVIQTGYFEHPENKKYLNAKRKIGKHNLKIEETV